MFAQIHYMKKSGLTGLVHVPSRGYDFDDVIKNVESLLDQLFPTDSVAIRNAVAALASKYESKIKSDYWRFIDLANSEPALRTWDQSYRGDFSESPLKMSVLDLYFQMTMVPNWDVYNDILIHAYLEDIQPLIKI
jgi:hypothetical protein